ncbi:MAG: UDP-N-acetylglucosamine 4,6-dehydratase (inverting) [Acidobacteriota bacterium]
MDWSNLSVLVTGGTGSFGKQFVDTMLNEYHPKKLIIFSRDELKQHEMRQKYPDSADTPLRFFIGDIRDQARLNRAFDGVDIVVHAAAMKQVPACEYNPFEAILTNVIGTKNVIDAAIDNGVSKVLGISTDKAVNPVNLYGATKLCAEKMMVQANAYAGKHKTRFSICRYGNVVGSRGSVIPLFREQRAAGRVTVTNADMTRFWITLPEGVGFVRDCIDRMKGGEIFVPKIPSMKVTDLARIIAPECSVQFIGIRPGEKIHEVLISEDEGRYAIELDGMYIIQPADARNGNNNGEGGKPLSDGFRYASDSNERWYTEQELQQVCQ